MLIEKHEIEQMQMKNEIGETPLEGITSWIIANLN